MSQRPVYEEEHMAQRRQGQPVWLSPGTAASAREAAFATGLDLADLIDLALLELLGTMEADIAPEPPVAPARRSRAPRRGRGPAPVIPIERARGVRRSGAAARRRVLLVDLWARARQAREQSEVARARARDVRARCPDPWGETFFARYGTR
jgi:hypothetical protein